MELRDITEEGTLLKSYKTVYVDGQKRELLKIYRDKQRRFPVFTRRVFRSSKTSPFDLLDYKIRRELDDDDPGRIFILERIDRPREAGLTRIFFVWVSPNQVDRFRKSPADEVHIQANVLFHARQGLETYPAYWQGGLSPFRNPNWLELGARYLCKDMHSVTQHFCAGHPGSGGEGLERRTCPWSMMVVIPVSNVAAYASLAHPEELRDALQQVGKLCFEGVTGTIVPASNVRIDRVAVSGYSRSGELLAALFRNAESKGGSAFMEKVLKEVWAFDIMLDGQGLTKRGGYDQFWKRLTKWQGGDSDKKIRLYSAESGSVAGIYAELIADLNRHGGGYRQDPARFSFFNGRAKAGESGRHAGLADAYEIHSTDNSRSLVMLPSANSVLYLPDEVEPKNTIANPAGFRPGGLDYEPELRGHNWFVARLQSHALFHSGF